MKKILIYCSILILTLTGCEKNDLEPVPNFIKTLSTESAYLSRGVLSLSDGSSIVYGLAWEDVSLSNIYGSRNPVVAKYDAKGSLLWQKELPEEVYVLWDCVQLTNGELVFIGLNSERESEQVGLVKTTREGELLQIETFENITNQGIAVLNDRSLASMDAVALGNGGLALTTRVRLSAFLGPLHGLRLMVFDNALSILSDETFVSEDPDADYGIGEVRIAEADDGNIWITAATLLYTPIAQEPHELSHAAVMEFDGDTYERISLNRFVGDIFYRISALATSRANNPIWTFAPQPDQGQGRELFNLRNQEVVSVGPEIQIRETNSAGEILNSSVIANFKGRAYLHAGIPCTDGGFIFIGTSNINLNLQNPSILNILIVRLDDNLNVMWQREIATNNSALGSGLAEVPDGFLISGSSLSIDEEYRIILFKINKNGQLSP